MSTEGEGIEEGSPHFSTEQIIYYKKTLSVERGELEADWGNLSYFIDWRPLALKDSLFSRTNHPSRVLAAAYGIEKSRDLEESIDLCIRWLEKKRVHLQEEDPPTGEGGTSYNSATGEQTMWIGSDFSTISPAWQLFRLQHMYKSFMLRSSFRENGTKMRDDKGLLELLRTDYDFILSLWRSGLVDKKTIKNMLFSVNDKIARKLS